MRPAIIVATLIALLSLGILLFRPANQTDESKVNVATPAPSPSPEPTSLQAGFMIFTSGTKRDFSSSRYHNLDTTVFISGDNSNLVQVRGAGITWQNFFDTLPMQLSEDCLVTGTGQRFCSGAQGILRLYLNGVQDQQALSRLIKSDNQLLVTFGNESEAAIDKQLSQIPVSTH